MNSASSITRRLWWKETRQLLPLLLVAVGLFTCAQVLVCLEPSTDRSAERAVFQWQLCYASAVLFAVGIGIVLIGLEHESGTINWLTSLPVRRSTLVRTKLSVATMGLVAAWLISFFGLLLTQIVIRHQLPPNLWELLVVNWPSNLGSALQTLFLLTMSFAMAWLWRSPLVALVIMIPVAILGSVVVRLPYDLQQGITAIGRYSEVPAAYTTTGYFILTLAGLWFSYRLGLKQLSADRHARIRLTALLDPQRSSRAPWAFAAVPRSQNSALLWLFFRQHAVTLTILALCSLFAGVSLLLHSSGAGILPGSIALIGLGAITFQGDVSNRQLHFLSDRGVSPRRMWWTRQAGTTAILLAAGLVAITAFVVWNHTASTQRLLNNVPLSPLSLLIACGLLMYAIAQWSSQLIRSPVLSVTTSVAMASMGAAFFFREIEVRGTPLWLSIPCAFIPLLATYLSMRAWMDRRFTPWFWIAHAATLCVLLAAPLLEYWIFSLRTPGATAETEASITRAYHSYHNSWPQRTITIGSESEGTASSENDSEQDASQQAASQDSDPLTSRWEVFNRTTRQAISPADVAISFSPAFKEARLYVNMFGLLSGSARLSDDEQSLRAAQYREAVHLVSEIVPRLRATPSIYAQDQADVLEITLLIELRRADARARMGDELHESCRTILNDRASRVESRRRAVAYSWFHRDKLPNAQPNLPKRARLANDRQTDRLLEAFWQLTNADIDDNTDALRLWIQANRGNSGEWEFYMTEPAKEYLNADDLSRFTFATWEGAGPMPGRYWNGAWE